MSKILDYEAYQRTNKARKADTPNEAVAILRAVGGWYNSVKESLLDVEPASHLIENREVLLTRRGNTLYVHLHLAHLVGFGEPAHAD